jgi:hypothetical protein
VRGARVLRRLGVGLAVLAIVFGAMWIAFPPHVDERDGPADPILPVRRAVLGVLRSAGIVSAPFFFADPWLPSAPSTISFSGADDDAEAKEIGTWTQDRWRIVPVYRALLVPAGRRVELTFETTSDVANDVVALRLVAQRGGFHETLAESLDRERGSTARTSQWTVRGFVPTSVDGYGFEALGVGGDVVASAGYGRFATSSRAGK